MPPKISNVSIWERLGELQTETSRLSAETSNTKEAVRDLRKDFAEFQKETRTTFREFDVKLDERNGARFLARIGVVAALAAIGGERAVELLIKAVGNLI